MKRSMIIASRFTPGEVAVGIASDTCGMMLAECSIAGLREERRVSGCGRELGSFEIEVWRLKF